MEEKEREEKGMSMELKVKKERGLQGEERK